MDDFCIDTGFTIFKIAGLKPEGLNRLHKAIEELKALPELESEYPVIKVLDSKYDSGYMTYTTEIKVLHRVVSEDDSLDRSKKIPITVITSLFAAIDEFV